MTDNVVNLEPASNGLVPTLAHRKIFQALRAALVHSNGALTVITGIAGIGKTVTIRAFAEGRANVAVSTLSHLSGGAQTGLIRISNELGEQSYSKGVNLEDTLKRRLWSLRLGRADHEALLILDEAQHGCIGLLEELRYLGENCRIGIALVGNQKLRDAVKLMRRSDPQIVSRIVGDLDLEKLYDTDLDLFCKRYSLTASALERVRDLAKLGGAIRTVKNLVMVATEIRGQRAGYIDVSHIDQAAQVLGLVK